MERTSKSNGINFKLARKFRKKGTRDKKNSERAKNEQRRARGLLYFLKQPDNQWSAAICRSDIGYRPYVFDFSLTLPPLKHAFTVSNMQRNKTKG